MPRRHSLARLFEVLVRVDRTRRVHSRGLSPVGIFGFAVLMMWPTIGVLHLPTPALPFAYTVAERRTNGQLLPEETLRALRVVAVAATAIGLALLAVTSGRTRGARLGQLGAAIATWTLLTPPAWFAGGPLFPGTMILHWPDEHAAQARIFGAGWLWVPTHSVLPLELVACLLFGLGVSRVAWMLERSTWLAAMGKTRASTSLRRHD